MFYRSTLVTLAATLALAGCSHKAAEAPATVEVSAAEATPAVSEFAAGPTQINVSHILTRADDGSTVILTIDDKEAGMLGRGDSKALFVSAGKHKVGGYVQTLFGLGRVSIQSVDVTTNTDQAVHVAYSVTRNKPAFAVTSSTAG
ncbi:hypothetical protein [Erwinia pyrifoliae]|uniref:Lipoprotein n=1 Tax=Erwinia pyrifoliae TaxID=79967 RepID=A0ABY5XCJ2_ERWPY|nr:hypothetical protein [Erwinia pyrifoliae]AUX72704.1 hypothetical protein CPI84_09575 [Erwinia pyrifoliae]MCA8877034.1 hypothetical protein [Erwinia pyrifoliae]MCT2387185.1 hypothetical protein [Erwinia pyrifoliae]MCU8587215.1 hypothetical protein [Erwinia pyrifoliae]UWS31076.1 hypothetical protein NYP81_06390 [Erwinia pyrifoliae]